LSDLLAWLEASALGHAMRGMGSWGYGLVNLAHILGVASLFGALLVLDLRLLGAWRRVPLTAIATPVVPVATTGFAIAVASGVCLLTTNATEYIGNPFLYIKFPAIVLGVCNVAVLNTLPAWKERATRTLSSKEQSQLAVAGAVSLACWLTAAGAGRMIGYW
jgi:hypothetical protein